MVFFWIGNGVQKGERSEGKGKGAKNKFQARKGPAQSMQMAESANELPDDRLW